MHSQLLDTV